MGVLNSKNPGAISISPSLVNTENLFQGIGYGSVVKIVLIFNSSFWNKILPEVQFILSDAVFESLTIWSKSNVLRPCGYKMGEEIRAFWPKIRGSRGPEGERAF